jgi:hypothetical protein
VGESTVFSPAPAALKMLSLASQSAPAGNKDGQVMTSGLMFGMQGRVAERIRHERSGNQGKDRRDRIPALIIEHPLRAKTTT